MFKKFAKVWAYMVVMFGAGSEKTLIKDGVLNLTDEMKAQLQTALGPKTDIDKVVKEMNEELAVNIQKKDPEGDQELKDLRAEAIKMLKDHEFTDDEASAIIADPSLAEGASEKQMLTALMAKSKEQDKKIEKLLKAPEVDSPEALIKLGENVNHSATHLFGGTEAYNAFENRNWNKRAAGLSTTPTNFMAADGVEFQKLKNDIDLYYRENPTEVRSLHRDMLQLPSFWNIRRNVDDKVTDGNIVSAEITQGRKKGWLPKNNQLIQPEEGQIFPVQVDIEFSGYELQKIEASWLNFMNKEGSQPFKMTFVRFLLNELDKKARNEDRMVAINGVYVPTPDNATVAGLAIHRGDGISIQLFRASRFKNLYKSAQLGKPTTSNILDYIKALIEKNLPEEEKNVSGLVIYLSPTWIRRYKERKRLEFGGDSNYTGAELTEIEGFPNVKLCPLHDWEGTDYMVLTYDNNIELMENVPGENSMYRFDFDLRDTRVLADYKWGSRVIHIGTEVKDTDPLAFKVQTVWDNGLSPFKDDFFVRLYQTTAGKIDISKYYSNITFVSGFGEDVENITNTFEGQIVRVKGNTNATGKVVDDGNITLAGNTDFDLSTGGTLTLRADAAGDLTEVKREVAPPVNPDTSVDFSSTAIDADQGKVFNYTGGVVTLAAITNGYEGQEIKINGGPGGALTLVDVPGNIEVNAGAVLADATNNITLTLIDGIWTEVARTI